MAGNPLKYTGGSLIAHREQKSDATGDAEVNQKPSACAKLGNLRQAENLATAASEL